MKSASSRISYMKLAAFPLLVVLVLAAGCANLTAIREFASISAESAEYTKLVTNYVESPIRLKRYQSPSRHDRLDHDAAARAAQRERLLLRQTLIVEYMNALGWLATDEAVTKSKEIGDLRNAVKEAKFADAKEADAFSAIANVVVKGATDWWRRKQLKALITTSNEPFQIVVQSLRDIVEKDFSGDPLREKEAIRQYCSDLVLQSSDKAGIAALQEWCDLRLTEIDAREEAIKSYVKILEKIAQGHRQLYEGRNDLSKKQLLQEIRGYAKELRTTFATIRNL